jgi:hypothetical protein
MPPARGTLARIEREFVRLGLLLQHDSELPSFTALVAGGPIKGSWWGHPLGHDLYRLLGEFGRGSGLLSAKLVNGKITYVHPRLWQAFLKLARHDESVRMRALSPLAKSLRIRVVRARRLRIDELAASGVATQRQLTAAARELEENVLVHADSVHTATGAHAKVLQSWPDWARSNDVQFSRYRLSDAREELAQAIRLLRQGASRSPKVPLLDGAALTLAQR